MAGALRLLGGETGRDARSQSTDARTLHPAARCGLSRSATSRGVVDGAAGALLPMVGRMRDSNKPDETDPDCS